MCNFFSDTTFDITLKVEWVELTEYSPKSDVKTHENAPKRPQLKDVLSSGNKSRLINTQKNRELGNVQSLPLPLSTYN